MKKYIIRNSGESQSTIIKELTEEQYKFLDSIFEEVNNSNHSGCYAPWISIYEADENDLNEFENDKFY